MKVEESIKRFNDEYPSLSQEENQLSRQIFEVVRDKLAELRPIINLMSEKNYYFTHPSLSDRIKTTNGPIIGRNLNDNSEIFTVSKNIHFIDKVNGRSDEVENPATMTLEQFVKLCDLEFLLEGLHHIEGFLENALDAKSTRIETQRKFLDKLGIQDIGI